MVSDRITLSNADPMFNWEWTRHPSGRTRDELDNLINLIAGTSFDQNQTDRWVWSHATNGEFTVKQLATIVDDQLLQNVAQQHETLRNNLVPRKLEIFVWRVIKKRIPVRAELDKRGIDLHTVRCPVCDEEIESVDHCLIFCSFAMEVWNRVNRWWKLGSFVNLSSSEILHGKANTSIILSSFGKKIWQAVEWVRAYYIWKNRNNVIFHNKSWSVPVALSEIQLKSYEWISKRSNGRNFEWLTWLSDPSVYLTIS
ncbi:uncharacterized protein [Rutidosis leptorrhynchoides]|uniref:uncharacterized protein n=1 Tax=Rutidosis leptorrhynchoides TaxID=125765 RepID=UPI003A991A3D